MRGVRLNRSSIIKDTTKKTIDLIFSFFERKNKEKEEKMELERFVCNICGKPHELCRCGEDIYFSKKKYKKQNIKEENTFPKFLNNGEVEVTEGIIISEENYNSFYK